MYTPIHAHTHIHTSTHTNRHTLKSTWHVWVHIHMHMGMYMHTAEICSVFVALFCEMWTNIIVFKVEKRATLCCQPELQCADSGAGKEGREEEMVSRADNQNVVLLFVDAPQDAVATPPGAQDDQTLTSPSSLWVWNTAASVESEKKKKLLQAKLMALALSLTSIITSGTTSSKTWAICYYFFF